MFLPFADTILPEERMLVNRIYVIYCDKAYYFIFSLMKNAIFHQKRELSGRGEVPLRLIGRRVPRMVPSFPMDVRFGLVLAADRVTAGQSGGGRVCWGG